MPTIRRVKRNNRGSRRSGGSGISVKAAFIMAGLAAGAALLYASMEQREYGWRTAESNEPDRGYKKKLRTVGTDFGSMTLRQKNGCNSNPACFAVVAKYDAPFSASTTREANFRIPTRAEIQGEFGDILNGRRPNIYGDTPYRGVHGVTSYRLEPFRHAHLQELGYHSSQREKPEGTVGGRELGRSVYSDETHRHVRFITRKYAGKAAVLTCDYTIDRRNWLNITLRSTFGLGSGLQFSNQSRYWFGRAADGIETPSEADVGRGILRRVSRNRSSFQQYDFLQHPLLPPDRTAPTYGGFRPLVTLDRPQPAQRCPEQWSHYTRKM